jgi:hypothetical protein
MILRTRGSLAGTSTMDHSYKTMKIHCKQRKIKIKFHVRIVKHQRRNGICFLTLSSGKQKRKKTPIWTGDVPANIKETLPFLHLAYVVCFPLSSWLAAFFWPALLAVPHLRPRCYPHSTFHRLPTLPIHYHLPLHHFPRDRWLHAATSQRLLSSFRSPTILERLQSRCDTISS